MPLNILLAGGATPAVVQAFADAASVLAGGGDVLTVGGPFRRAGELDEMRTLCRTRQIGLVVPTLDDDLPIWAAMSGGLADDGATVAVSPAATVALCHDRYLALRSLAAMGFPAAPTWLPSQVTPGQAMPVIVTSRTPRHHVPPARFDTYEALDRYLSTHPDSIIQTAPEQRVVEIDVCCDASGRLVVIGRPEFAEVAVCVTAAIHVVGAASIEAAIENDHLVIRGVSARFSGRLAGDIPRALVEVALGVGAGLSGQAWMGARSVDPARLMGAVA